jgi:hypothetical protein
MGEKKHMTNQKKKTYSHHLSSLSHIAQSYSKQKQNYIFHNKLLAKRTNSLMRIIHSMFLFTKRKSWYYSYIERKSRAKNEINRR